MSFDPARPIYSESAALLCASPDARSGLNLRICRYPSAGLAWLWVVAFVEGRVVAHTDHELHCDAEVMMNSDKDEVCYVAGNPIVAEFRRSGKVGTPASASVRIRLPKLGDLPHTVDADFEPRRSAQGTLPGRTESFGTVRARVTVGGVQSELEGLAQWHEQHQKDPRFQVPFTYATLRGEELSFVGLAGPKRSGGFVVTDQGATRAVGVDLSDELTLDLEDGRTLTGSVATVYDYTLPLYGKPWCGRQVRATLESHSLSGSINRWKP